MTESKVSKATREKLECERVNCVVEAIRKAANIAVEEGPWLVFMADLFAVGGELIEGRDNFLISQRAAIVKSLKALTSEDISVKDFGFIDASIPNPGAHFFGWLAPLVDSLEASETVTMKKAEVGWELGWGPVAPYPKPKGVVIGETVIVKKYYALPIYQRLLFSIVVPGIFRMSYNILQRKLI